MHLVQVGCLCARLWLEWGHPLTQSCPPKLCLYTYSSLPQAAPPACTLTHRSLESHTHPQVPERSGAGPGGCARRGPRPPCPVPPAACPAAVCKAAPAPLPSGAPCCCMCPACPSAPAAGCDIGAATAAPPAPAGAPGCTSCCSGGGGAYASARSRPGCNAASAASCPPRLARSAGAPGVGCCPNPGARGPCHAASVDAGEAAPTAAAAGAAWANMRCSAANSP